MGLGFGEPPKFDTKLKNEIHDKYIKSTSKKIQDFEKWFNGKNFTNVPLEDVVKLALIYVLEWFILSKPIEKGY